MKIVQKILWKQLDKVKVLSMSEEQIWEIYLQMSHIPRIKDFFELQRQLALVTYMDTDLREAKGVVKCIDEILEYMNNAPKHFKQLKEQEKKENDIFQGGYKSII